MHRNIIIIITILEPTHKIFNAVSDAINYIRPVKNCNEGNHRQVFIS